MVPTAAGGRSSVVGARGMPQGAARGSQVGMHGSAGGFAPGANMQAGGGSAAAAQQSLANCGIALDDEPMTLYNDPALMVQLGQEQLEVIDNELFEPLNTLDDELREMCIDIVNEKVRAILSVDPSKFKGGKLPFGLRPDNGGDAGQRILQLEGELEQQKTEYLDLKEANTDLTAQLEAAKRGIASLQAQRAAEPKPQALTGRTAPQQAPQEEAPKPATPVRARGRVIEKEEAPVIVQQGMDNEAVMQLVMDAKKDLTAEVNKLKDEAAAAAAKLAKVAKAEEEAKTHGQKHLQRAEKAEDEVKEIKVKLKEETEALHKSQKRVEALEKEKAELEKQLAKPEPKKKKEKTVVQEPDFGLEAKEELEKQLKLAKDKILLIELKAKASYAAWKKAVQKFQPLADIKDSDLKKKVEDLLKASADMAEEADKSVRALEDWGDEVYQYIKMALRQAQDAANKVPEKIVVHEEVHPQEVVKEVVTKEVVKEVVKADPQDAIEIKRLNSRLNKQQEEISRLLITIDELRARMEMVNEIAEDAPVEVQKVIRHTMKKAGLKEIMEAANVPKLKGVFERLYQDAVQRIQRLGLIRERMLIANKAYSHIVNAIVSKADEANVKSCADELPDLDRLSETAAATLQGMWYPSMTLFKNTCEYAIAQGIESSLMKSQKLSLSEVMEASAENFGMIDPGDDDPNSPNYKPRRRAGPKNDRPPGRGGGEKRAAYPGTTTGGDAGHAFWELPGGIKGPKSPRDVRKGHLNDPEPSSFASYIAALRESRGDLTSDEWNRVPLPARSGRQLAKSEGVEFIPKTLKASISNSRSLPVLPKGRGMCQQAAAVDPQTADSRDF